MASSFPISMLASSEDAELFISIVNQGIDARLEAFTGLNHRFDGGRLHLDFPDDEIPLLLRRLYEFETEHAELWADDIATIQYDIEII